MPKILEMGEGEIFFLDPSQVNYVLSAQEIHSIFRKLGGDTFSIPETLRQYSNIRAIMANQLHLRSGKVALNKSPFTNDILRRIKSALAEEAEI